MILNRKNLILVGILSMAVLAFVADAQTSYTLLEPLPTTGDNPTFAEYMPGLIRFLVLFAVVAAVVMIAIGGVMYAGSEAMETQKTGKSMISDALLGLAIVLLSYLILYTINPDLVNLRLTIPGLPSSSNTGGNAGTGPLVGGTSGSSACISPSQCSSNNCPFFPGTSQGICQPAGCNNPNGCSSSGGTTGGATGGTTGGSTPGNGCTDSDCGGVKCSSGTSCFCAVGQTSGGTCQ